MTRNRSAPQKIRHGSIGRTRKTARLCTGDERAVTCTWADATSSTAKNSLGKRCSTSPPASGSVPPESSQRPPPRAEIGSSAGGIISSCGAHLRVGVATRAHQPSSARDRAKDNGPSARAPVRQTSMAARHARHGAEAAKILGVRVRAPSDRPPAGRASVAQDRRGRIRAAPALRPRNLTTSALAANRESHTASARCGLPPVHRGAPSGLAGARKNAPATARAGGHGTKRARTKRKMSSMTSPDMSGGQAPRRAAMSHSSPPTIRGRSQDDPIPNRSRAGTQSSTTVSSPNSAPGEARRSARIGQAQEDLSGCSSANSPRPRIDECTEVAQPVSRMLMPQSFARRCAPTRGPAPATGNLRRWESGRSSQRACLRGTVVSTCSAAYQPTPKNAIAPTSFAAVGMRSVVRLVLMCVGKNMVATTPAISGGFVAKPGSCDDFVRVHRQIGRVMVIWVTSVLPK